MFVCTCVLLGFIATLVGINSTEGDLVLLLYWTQTFSQLGQQLGLLAWH